MDSNQTRRTSQNGKIYFKHQSNLTSYYSMLQKLFWYYDTNFIFIANNHDAL